MKSLDNFVITVPRDSKSVFDTLYDPEFTPIYCPEITKEIVNGNTRELKFIDGFSQQLKITTNNNSIMLHSKNFFEKYTFAPVGEIEGVQNTKIYFEKYDSAEKKEVRGRTGIFDPSEKGFFLRDFKSGMNLSLMKEAFWYMTCEPQKLEHIGLRRLMDDILKDASFANIFGHQTEMQELNAKWSELKEQDSRLTYAKKHTEKYYSLLSYYNEKYIPSFDLRNRIYGMLLERAKE